MTATLALPEGAQTWDFGRLAEVPEGPWTGEPDKAQWVDAVTGLDCLIVRQPHHGALCGYVGIPFEHQLHGAHWEDVQFLVDVHDGISYSELCNEGDPDGVCHIPLAGRPEDVWWFGFACSGTWDYAPVREQRHAKLRAESPVFAHMPPMDELETYRPIGFVASEVTRLAAQLKALEAEPRHAAT